MLNVLPGPAPPAASCDRCSFFEPLTDDRPAGVGGCTQPRHAELRLRVTPRSGCADFTPGPDAPAADPQPLAEPVSPAEEEHAFVLQKVQPALLGLMDGSVSTLAPLFAAAELTGNPRNAFWIGTAASLGAGISMGLAEALSDDGNLTGRGSGAARGVITGLATIAGGMLHTLPFLLPNLRVALYLAYAVVVVELLAIAYIRFHFMKTPLSRTVAQVILGGGIVFAIGILLGKLGTGG